MVTQARMSLEEFLALPETKPYREYVRGEVIPKPMPNTDHSRLVARLVTRLSNHLEKTGEAYVDTELRHISVEEQRIYLPDVSVTHTERWPTERQNPVEVTPDLVAEVVSPDDTVGDVMEKVDFHLHLGVRVVWLVDPRRKGITVFRPGEAPHVVRPPEPLCAAPALDGFELALDDLFAALERPER